MDHAFITGGIFSSYNTQNIFSPKYSNLKNLLIENQDCDIFFVANEKKIIEIFDYYNEKFSNFLIEESYQCMHLTIKLRINSTDPYLFNLIYITTQTKYCNNILE